MVEESKKQVEIASKEQDNDEEDMPVIKDREVYEEEQERRRLMLEVIARSLDTFTK